MIINLNPQYRKGSLVVQKAGDALTINGMEYDFSPLPDGATLPADAISDKNIFGPVERIDGVLRITLWLPLDPSFHYSAAARFPAPIINPPDGLLELPQ